MEGKGPQFKTNTTSSEGHRDWTTRPPPHSVHPLARPLSRRRAGLCNTSDPRSMRRSARVQAGDGVAPGLGRQGEEGRAQLPGCGRCATAHRATKAQARRKIGSNFNRAPSRFARVVGAVQRAAAMATTEARLRSEFMVNALPQREELGVVRKGVAHWMSPDLGRKGTLPQRSLNQGR